MKTADTVVEAWGLWDLIKSCKSADEDSIHSFRRSLARLFSTKVSRIALFPSARLGLTKILKSLEEKTSKKVLLSSFNCPVVRDAVLQAGFIPSYFHPTPSGFFDWNQILNSVESGVSAVIIPHLFGAASASNATIQDFRSLGLTVIEDCSHTLGAMGPHGIIGSSGDFTMVSFNYDKPISLGGGGAVIANTSGEFSDSLHEEEPNYFKEFIELLALRNLMLLRRSVNCKSGASRSLIVKISQGLRMFYNKIGVPFSGGMVAASGIGPVRAKLGEQLIEIHEEIIQIRNRNAALILESCGERAWPWLENTSPAWLRLRVRVSENTSNWLQHEGRKKGLRIGNYNWPNSLDPTAPVESILWAKGAVDIPVHHRLTDKQLDWLVSGLKGERL